MSLVLPIIWIGCTRNGVGSVYEGLHLEIESIPLLKCVEVRKVKKTIAEGIGNNSRTSESQLLVTVTDEIT
jgi:hypothetical protein